MFRRWWDRLSKLWRAEPCAECGAPSVGFHAAVAGKVLAQDADGKPLTKYYLAEPRRLCAACMRANECR